MKFKWIITSFTLVFLIQPGITFCQKTLELFDNGDSAKQTAVPLVKIPIVSLETIVKLEKIAESFITDEQLNAEKVRNDSILKTVDSILSIEEAVDYDSLLSRNLDNKMNFWTNYKEKLKKQGKKLEKIVEELTSKSNRINSELKLWTNTKTVFDSTFTDSLISNSIDEIIFQADSFQQIALKKTNSVFKLLKTITAYDIRIDAILSRIDAENKKRQEEVFTKTRPSIFELNHSRSLQWNVKKHIYSYIEENETVIRNFYRNNFSRIIFYAVYLSILVLFFFFLKRRSKKFASKKNNLYQQSVLAILRRPLSVSIILGIYSAGLFFTYRPPIISDISILILIIPILDIMAHVSRQKATKYYIIFTMLVLLRFINYIFPPVSPIHSVLLLITGGLEVYFLISLLRNLKKSDFKGQTFYLVIRIVLVLQLFASVVGIIATITGHLRLARIAIELSITNFLVGLLLIITSVTLIGLIQLAIDGDFLKKFKFIQKRNSLMKRRTSLIITFLAILFWFDYVLQILKVNNNFYTFLGSVLNFEISLGSASFTAGNIILFFFVIWLSVLISGMIRAVLEDDVLNNMKLKKGVPRMISVVIRFSLISIGVFLAVSAVGMPLNQLTIIFSAFSVGIGFGLQNIVNNFVSGVILLFERPIQIGDTVEIGNLVGTVKAMGIRSSNVRTFDGAEVVVPNANLISNEVINWTLSDKKRRIEIISGVAYGSDVHKVQKILLNILNQHPDILQKPEPLVLFNDLGESSLDFRLLFWTDNFDNWVIIKSEIIFKIYDTLNEAGIEIPFPQRDLHIKTNEKEK